MSFDPNRSAAPPPFTPAPPEPYAPTGPYAVPTGPVVASPPVIAQPPALPAAKRKGSGGAWLNIVLVIAAAVAIGGVAFAVGRSTAPASAAANGRGNFGAGNGFPNGGLTPGASGQPGFGRGGFGGGGLTIRGTVESVNGNTLTIKTASGQTVQVTTGASTTYNTQAAASASDVQAGKTVQVQLDFGGQGRPNASAAPGAPVGTAGSVTIIP